MVLEFRLDDTLLADITPLVTLAAQCSWGEGTGLLLCHFLHRICGYYKFLQAIDVP